jgi:tetratricopeptide (TPR) repeat protein
LVDTIVRGSAFLAVALDAAAIWPGSPIGTLPRLGLHVLAAVCCATGVRAARDGSSAGVAGADWLIFSLVLCFPVLGPFVALAARARTEERDAAERNLLEEYRALVDVGHEPDRVPSDARADDWERTWRALDLASFAQVLDAQRDPDVMASLFDSALKLEPAVACRLFRRALSSRGRVARYYASTALARREEGCDRELAAARRALSEAPGNVEALLRVGDARVAYVDLSSPGDPVARFHLAEAIKVYQLVVDGERDRARVIHHRVRLARALLAAGDASAAWPHFRQALEEGACDSGTVTGAAESALAAGDLAGLSWAVALAYARRPGSERIRLLHAFWCAPGASL